MRYTNPYKFSLFERVDTPQGNGYIFAMASYPNIYDVMLDGEKKGNRWKTSKGFEMGHSCKTYPERVLNRIAE